MQSSLYAFVPLQMNILLWVSYFQPILILSMTEEICEQLLASVAGELDHYIDDYSEKFLDKI